MLRNNWYRNPIDEYQRLRQLRARNEQAQSRSPGRRAVAGRADQLKREKSRLLAEVERLLYPKGR